MSYFIPVLVGIAFVYFDSTLHKLASPTWLKGLGMWAPASLPYVVHLDTSWLLNIKWLAILLGYVSMVFEFLFLFLFPFRKYRIILTIIGAGLHLGILVQFPIPFFALGFGSLYLLMVPVGFWKRINFNKHSVKKLTLYYDAECPLCARTKIIIEHFDISNRIQFLSVQQHARQNPALNSVSDDELLDNIYSVDTKGNIYQGIDTYVQVLNAITYLKPLSWFTRIPGIYHLGKIVYAFVASNRTTERCTEDNCGYDPPSPPADDRDFKILKGISLHNIKMYGVAIGLCFLITLQCIVSYNSPAVWYARKYSGLNNTTVGAILGRVSDKTTDFSRTFFGILNHNVFLDFHMAHYNRIVAVTYIDKQGVEHFLPITRPSGQPDFYQYGPFWAHWAFQVVTPTPIQPMVEKGVMDYTAFWAGKNNVDLNHFIFRVKVKRIEDINGWQPNFLKRQIAKRWQDAGYIEWKGYKFTSHIKPINSF
jgi:predicted DCC family thiol-disulfide oxidoreductase YuxK